MSVRKYVDNSKKRSEESGIPQEKLDWMKEIGTREWIKPMKYYVVNIENNCMYNLSEQFIKETPLPELKKSVEDFLPPKEEE